MYDNRLFQLRPMNWQWLVLTFCLLILFHLFPSFVVVGGAKTNMELFLRRETAVWPMLAWMATGIFAISCFVGFRSEPVTILEPGLASVFYLGSLFLTMTHSGEFVTVRSLVIFASWVVLMHLLAFLIGCGGAAAGEWLQMRKQKNQVA